MVNSTAKIQQSHDKPFILRVNCFILRLKSFNLNVINFILRVNGFTLRVKFYSACIWLIYSFGETSFKRLKTCENALPDENPDDKATISSLADESSLSILHACSMRRVLIRR